MEFNMDWILLLEFLLAVVLPLLVGLVTKTVTKSSTKALLHLALSAVAGFLTELLSALTSGTPFDIAAALIAAFTVFIVGVGMHFGLYKPTTLAAKAQAALGGDTPQTPAPGDSAL